MFCVILWKIWLLDQCDKCNLVTGLLLFIIVWNLSMLIVSLVTAFLNTPIQTWFIQLGKIYFGLGNLNTFYVQFKITSSKYPITLASQNHNPPKSHFVPNLPKHSTAPNHKLAWTYNVIAIEKQQAFDVYTFTIGPVIPKRLDTKPQEPLHTEGSSKYAIDFSIQIKACM